MKMRQALFTRLEWQLHALTQQLHAIESQLATLDDAIQRCENDLTTFYSIPSSIIPEHEIARGHFNAHQQQKRDELNAEKEPLLARQSELTRLKIQRNIDLKRLEKHQARLFKSEQLQKISQQQNDSDEWMIQRQEGV